MLTGRAVTVADMAQARERRVQRRQAFIQTGKTVVWFSLNIPGPVKDAPLLRRVFLEGEGRLCELLKPSVQKRWEAFTGWEGVYCCDSPAKRVKEEMILLEETHPLGRLFDLDVFSSDGRKLSRPQYRTCLLCGKQAQFCARSRIHSLPDLLAAVEKMAADYFDSLDAGKIGMLAEQALLYEVSVTPKPGLVDRNNNGAHLDMDLWLFLKSASVLRDRFTQCVKAGMKEEDPVRLFYCLRQLGICAEAEMRSATNGVNTHKGAIFSIGLLCGAFGHCLKYPSDPIQVVRQMAPAFLAPEQTAAGGFGSELFRQGTCGGIRVEAADGFPSVMNLALPAFRQALQRGFSENDAGVLTLLALLGKVEDTNMVRRGGREKAAEIREKAAKICKEPLSFQQTLRLALRMDQNFIAENLSPGGCADLLAVTWLWFHFMRMVESNELEMVNFWPGLAESF